jgi:hypothetical protein
LPRSANESQRKKSLRTPGSALQLARKLLVERLAARNAAAMPGMTDRIPACISTTFDA